MSVDPFWFGILILSALCYAALRLTFRSLIREFTVLPVLLAFEVLCVLFILPFAVVQGRLAFTWPLFLVVGLIVIIASAIDYFGLKSFESMSIGEREPILKLSVFFSLLAGVVVFGEIVKLIDLVGTLLLFCGVLVVTGVRGLRKTLFKPVFLGLLLVVLLSPVINILNTVALRSMPAVSLAAIAYAVQGIVYAALLRGKFESSVAVVKARPIAIVGTALLSIFAYVAFLSALPRVGISVATPVIQLTTVFTALGALIIYCDDRKQWKKTLLATVLAVIGSILIVV